MRSAISPEALDCSVSSLTPAALCKWLHACRNRLTDLVESYLAGFVINPRLGMSVEDDFDWRPNELAYEKNYLHSLPRRAWKRHSAMLLMSRELSTNFDKTRQSEPCVLQLQCNSAPRHCRVCEISSVPIWATSITDMGLIEYPSMFF